MTAPSNVLAFARKNGYETVEFCGHWNGYTCYEPLLTTSPLCAHVGLPLTILVKSNEIRMSTASEALEIVKETR